MARKLLPKYIRRSGAEFERVEGLLKSANAVDITKKKIETAGVPLTRIDAHTYAVSDEELHCFVIGDSGSGKTRRVILPTIHILAKAGESMVVSDPKGELYRTTGEMLRKKGYEVLVLNFRTPNRGNRWNPLGLIERLYRMEDRESRDKALMMLGEIVDVLADSVEDAKDPYWSMSAASVIRSIALMIMEYGKMGDLTFENISLLSREISACLGRNSDGGKKRTFMEFFDSLPKSSAIVNNLSVLVTNGDSTRDCIMSVLETMLGLYSSQETLLDLFSASEIDVERIGKKPTALFFILPDDSEALYPIATVFVKQIYSSLVALADAQPDGKLPTRTTFLLDEFANFAKMPSIESMLTAARSRGIRFVLVCQSMDQLTQKYGDTGRETLLANCKTWIYMSCRNLPFLQRLQELSGYYISPYTGEQVPLISVEDLQRLSIGEVLVFHNRCRPFKGYLDLDYSELDFGRGENGAYGELPNLAVPRIRRNLRLKDVYENAKSKNTGGEDERENAITLFGVGNYYGAAKYCIDRIGIDDSAKNNLAFLIRHCGLDVSKLKAPCSLDVLDLLKEGIKNEMPSALINGALYWLEKGDFQKATKLFESIKLVGWFGIIDFWHQTLWSKMQSAEGALVSLLLEKKGMYVLPDWMMDSIHASAEKVYGEYMHSSYFEALFKEE